MTANKDFKRIVRTRMEKTGESYAAARTALIRKPAPRPRAVAAVDHERVAGMKDDTVVARTGRGWKAWTKLLDAAEAHTWTHTAIARHVHALGVTHWWAQSVTIGYERIKGLRAIGQRRSGEFEVNKSRTFAVDLAALFAAFANARRRAKWLPGVKVVVRKAVENKNIRLVWPDGTRVEWYFQAKRPGKSTVVVQHTGLPNRESLASTRAYWAERLGVLAEVLAPRRLVKPLRRK